MPAPILLLLALILVPLAVALSRANELFCLRFERGGLRVVRGRIPQRLLSDLGDILRDPPPERAVLRGVVEDLRPVIHARGPLTEAQRQRIRNVVSTWPLARIRSLSR
jgi:Protein of unknown function (DUF3634)